MKNPAVGKTSIRFGPAFIRPCKGEDQHFELMRTVVTVRNDGGRIVREQHEQPIGPLAVYRVMRKGDIVPIIPNLPETVPVTIKSADPKTMVPFDLIMVWCPLMDKKIEDEIRNEEDGVYVEE